MSGGTNAYWTCRVQCGPTTRDSLLRYLGSMPIVPLSTQAFRYDAEGKDLRSDG